MQTSELSILIPVKNIEKDLARIFQFCVEQTKDLDAEYIFVDMGSSDKTVLEAVTFLKDFSLHGFVIQNGNSSVPAALNTAVQRAEGEYLTFLFARRLYSGFLPRYLDTAEHFGADVVFGCFTKEEVRAAERRTISSAIRQPSSTHFAREILSKKMGVDLAAFLVRRDFLLSKQISFDENCAFGYAGEFLLCSLLRAEKVMQSPVLLQRCESCELKRGKSGPVGYAVFQRTEAALRILEAAKTVCPEDGELCRLLEKETIPWTIMNSVDVVLREGVSIREVHDFLCAQGYDKLLSIDSHTDSALRRKVFFWKALPLLYRP